MSWRVVESIPVHPSIMTGSPERDRYIDVFIDTMRTVAAADISVVCYNFMPLLRSFFSAFWPRNALTVFEFQS